MAENFPGILCIQGELERIYTSIWCEASACCWGSLLMTFKFGGWYSSDRCQRSQSQRGNWRWTIDQQATFNTIQWVPGHAGVEGNEKADQVAKQAAGRPPGRGPKEISLAFACRAWTETITAQKQGWLVKELNKRSQQGQRTYRPQKNWQLDPAAAMAPKHLASRYFQPEVGTFSYRSTSTSDPGPRGCNLWGMWYIKGNNTPSSLWMSGMAAPMKQALQGPGDRRSYETHYGRRISTRTTPRRAQSYKGTATIPSQYQCSSTPSAPTADGGRARRDDEWGLEALEEAVRTGEG